MYRPAEIPSVCFEGSINPAPRALHSVSAQLRIDLSKYWRGGGSHTVALVGHADNVLGNVVWLPALGTNSVNTIPVSQGRTVYAGVEIGIGKRSSDGRGDRP